MEKPKFGDIIENHHAGENNPLRKGVFVRTCQRQRSLCWQLTNMKGKFWEQFVDKDSEYEIIGTIFDEKLDNIKRQAEEKMKTGEVYGLDGRLPNFDYILKEDLNRIIDHEKGENNEMG